MVRLRGPTICFGRDAIKKEMDNAKIASILKHLKWFACHADPDSWRRKSTRKDGTLYCECRLLYCDDILNGLGSAAATCARSH